MNFPVVSHIKVSLKTSPITLDNVCNITKERNIKCKNYNNFAVVKAKFTYIIFKSNIKAKKRKRNNHVNIVKIYSIENIREAVNYFLELFHCEERGLTIDNISATISNYFKLNLDEIILKEKYKYFIEDFLALKYNNQVFPGASIKFSIGTAVLFHSGKINLVGCKSLNAVKWLTKIVHAITSMNL